MASRLDGVLGFVVIDLTAHERVAARLEDAAVPDRVDDQALDSLRAPEAGRREQLVLDKPAPIDRTSWSAAAASCSTLRADAVAHRSRRA